MCCISIFRIYLSTWKCLQFVAVISYTILLIVKQGMIFHSLRWMSPVRYHINRVILHNFTDYLPKRLCPGSQQDMQFIIGLSLEQDNQNGCLLHYAEANRGRLLST